MGISEAELLKYFIEYAYTPWIIYLGIFLLMMASGFGLPFPEEITLISAGMVCYVASRPDLYPPPSLASVPVNAYVTAGVAFCSVVFADCLVFFLGKFFGGKILRSKRIGRFRDRMDKVAAWTVKYGMWAAGVFRFTPGLRFPGHFACGMMGLKVSKFILVDALAAGISVPTQVLLVAFYGHVIMDYLGKFKIVLGSLLLLLGLYYLVRYLWRRSAEKKKALSTAAALNSSEKKY